MRIPKTTALMIPLAIALGQADAATLCVDPANSPPCFATIQAAVDFAAVGDTIEVAINPSSKGYTENVVIDTADLTLVGQGIATGGIKDETCPPVVIDACETAIDPTDCGVNTGIGGDAVTVNVSGVTIKGFRIRHAEDGVQLNTGADDTTVEDVCFIDNQEHVSSHSDSVDNVTVKTSLFRGEEEGDSIHLEGNGTQILNNVFLTVDEAMRIVGDDFFISRNRVFTANDNCIIGEGDNGKIHDNTLTGCDESILYDAGLEPDIRRNVIERSADDAIDVNCETVGSNDPTTCTGGTIANNRINGVADDDEGIDAEGDNLVIENNTISSTADQGIRYQGSDGTIRGNTVRRAGSEDGDPGIDIEGDDNLIEGNTVELSSYVGIQNSLGDDNTYRQNVVLNNGRSGIFIEDGDDTIVDNNRARNNQGEGIANGTAATDTTIANNIATGNRTDICNSGTVDAVASVGNTFNTGGFATACVVDQ